MGQRWSDAEMQEINSWFNWDIGVGYFPRFRQVTVYPDEPLVVVRTRTGGGNRVEYLYENEHLRTLEGFDHDEDDDFDKTYAYWHYNIPERSVEYWRVFNIHREERQAAKEAVRDLASDLNEQNN